MTNWHDALDTQMDQHRWQRTQDGINYQRTFFNWMLNDIDVTQEIRDYVADDLSDRLIQTLWQADTIFLTSDMLHVIMQAAQDFRELPTFEEFTLITPQGFCVFEEPIVGTSSADKGKLLTVKAISWGPMGFLDMDTQKNGLSITYFTDTHDEISDFARGLRETTGINEFGPLVTSFFYPAQWGDEAPEDDGNLVYSVARLFLAMQIVAQQRIASMGRRPPARATRRRAQRLKFPQSEVTVITLRHKASKTQEPQDVNWSRRWLVRGHWRKQWYPSLERHQWKYIAEFVKGPPDKPLVLSERRIFNFKQ